MHSPQGAGENMLGFLCPSLKKKSSEQNNIQNTALVSGKIQRHVSSLNHSTWRQSQGWESLVTGDRSTTPWQSSENPAPDKLRGVQGSWRRGRQDWSGAASRGPWGINWSFLNSMDNWKVVSMKKKKKSRNPDLRIPGQEEKCDRFRGMSAHRGVRQAFPFFSPLVRLESTTQLGLGAHKTNTNVVGNRKAL